MDAATRAARQRVVGSIWTKLAYGAGSVAYGVKGNGFSYFLLLFYSQALGVDSASVGLAIFLTFLVDAFSDPVVGYLSDNLRTPFGRRHPFMYAAAIPVSVSFWFLWNPPEGYTNEQLFWYLLFWAILVRTLITLYEIPSSALVAEFTTDYDERTTFLSYRNMFGWVGGVIVAVITLTLLLDRDSATGSGFTDVQGFREYGLLASLTIFASIMVSALGTHRTIPYLYRSTTVPEKFSLGRFLREIFETLANPSFAALFLASLFSFVASGVSAALTFYIYGYFWGFESDQSGLITASVILSAVGAFVLAPRVSRALGKKRAAIIVGVLAFSIAPAPIVLRLFGLMPENGDPALFPIIFCVVVADMCLIIMVQILMQSMIADLVEDSQTRTARRSEGVFFAAISFTRKAVEGGGILIASALLAIIDFPVGRPPSEVPEEALFRLGAFYAPTLFTLWMIMLACLSFYRIDRARHEANLTQLGLGEAPEFVTEMSSRSD